MAARDGHLVRFELFTMAERFELLLGCLPIYHADIGNRGAS